MKKRSVPASPPVQYCSYRQFGGVDFSHDAILCDRTRSPDAVNLLSDINGLPEKRPGYRTCYRLTGEVFGLWQGKLQGETVFLCHAGTGLYRLPAEGEEPTLLWNDLPKRRLCGFFAEQNDTAGFWLADGERLLCYQGEEVFDLSTVAYVPTVRVHGTPDGTEGEALEEPNLLTPKRREQFVGDGFTKKFQLSVTQLDEGEVEAELISGEEITPLTGFTVDRAAGLVTFTTAPAKSADGSDNLRITYRKTVDHGVARLGGCTAMAFYGADGGAQVFLAGNPDHPNRDFWSHPKDPTYFPLSNTARIGSRESRIVGYAKLGEYLLVFKEPNPADASLYLRSAKLSGGKTVFTLKQAVVGLGAINSQTIKTLVADPLFLTHSGIYAVSSTSLTAERSYQSRSYYLDARLTAEPDLDRAVACVWKGYYLLFVGGRVYGLDSRKRSPGTGINSSFLYECCYWEDIPATAVLSAGEVLWFGTGDGRVCRFQTDRKDSTRYLDDGRPIYARWDTVADDDGLAAREKTMRRKGSVCVLKASARTGAVISCAVDGGEFHPIARYSMTLLSWETVDFSRFTFTSSQKKQPVLFDRSVRRYTYLQFRVENNEPGESLGIYELTKAYTVGGFGKE